MMLPFLVQMLQLHTIILPFPSGARGSSSVTVYAIWPQWQKPGYVVRGIVLARGVIVVGDTE